MDCTCDGEEGFLMDLMDFQPEPVNFIFVNDAIDAVALDWSDLDAEAGYQWVVIPTKSRRLFLSERYLSYVA